jgi:transposase
LAQVHPQRGWEALKRIGWSPQAPRPRHARAATPEQRAAFKGAVRVNEVAALIS